jgi:hypothetical protein
LVRDLACLTREDDNKPEDEFVAMVKATIGKTTRTRIEIVRMKNGGV